MATEEHDAEEQQDWPEAARLIEVTLDDASIGRNNAEVDHEREIAWLAELLARVPDGPEFRVGRPIAAGPGSGHPRQAPPQRR